MAKMAERQMQSLLLSQLSSQGWQILPKQTSITTHLGTFRSEVQRLNQLQLSDAEFSRLLDLMNVSMSEAFDIFRHGLSLVLDDNSSKTIYFYGKTFSDNQFQVAEEVIVEGVRTRRLDVVLFLNGLPIMAGELKKTGLGTAPALADINAYTKEGVYRAGLLKFIQLYFVSDGAISKYFAASLAAEGGEPYGNSFYWADVHNERITRLLANGNEGWASTFLTPENVFDLVTKFMCKTGGKDKRILVLRPYQIYAIKLGEEKLKSGKNGFLWHATGSGKTLTSYMLGCTLQANGYRTIMLLDRNDLAEQTIVEYSAFSGEAKTVSKGKDLIEALKDNSSSFTLTTMQSFHALLKRKQRRAKVASLFNEKVCFVIDECHRSTFGDMFKDIRKAFPESQFLGFTGTPILPENKAVGERITKDLFGDAIHVYTTKNAIDDGNVLPFEISEVNLAMNKKVKDLTLEEVELRRKAVGDYISSNFYKHTLQRNSTSAKHKLVKNTDFNNGYTALLATPSIKDAFEYWKLITPLFRKQKRTTAVIFSFGNGKDDTLNGRHDLAVVLEDYDEQFGTNFSKLYKNNDFEVVEKYLNDVTVRVKNKEIDLVIVAFMLLTGFDAKTLNTIYLDKNLKDHGLLQAMSRTNRVWKDPTKQVGNIILFSDRAMTDSVDDCIRLFSNGNAVDGVVLRKNFLELRNEISSLAEELHGHCARPDLVNDIVTANELKQVVDVFSTLRGKLTRIRTYDEWEGNPADWKHVGLGEEELEEFYSFIKDAKTRILTSPHENDDEEALEELRISVQGLSDHFLVNVAYINELLRNATFAPPREKAKWVKMARKALEASDDPEVQRQKQAIEETITEIEKPSSTVTSVETLLQTLEANKERLRRENLTLSAGTLGVSEDYLEHLVSIYEGSGIIPVADLDKHLRDTGVTIAERRVKKLSLDKIIRNLSRD